MSAAMYTTYIARGEGGGSNYPVGMVWLGQCWSGLVSLVCVGLSCSSVTTAVQ